MDFEESLEGFLQFLNWTSIISYIPALLVLVGMMLGTRSFKVAGSTFAVHTTLTWMSLQWLKRRFLSQAEKPLDFPAGHRP